MVWSVLKEARAEKSSAASIWLDIANAYGSIDDDSLVYREMWRSSIAIQRLMVTANSFVLLTSSTVVCRSCG